MSQSASDRIHAIAKGQGRVLKLSSFDLQTIPTSLAAMTQLEMLDLSNNKLTVLPGWLGELTQLKELHLQANRLTQLPDALGKLRNLEILALTLNPLEELPESIGELTNLKVLFLVDTKLSHLPDSIGRLSRLQRLNLGANPLTRLPDSLGDLRELRFLDLQGNKLTTLPESIANLTLLEQLDVHRNELRSLPDGIGKLTNLRKLDLHDNKLTELPDSIGDLSSIRDLPLTNNRLKTLPESIGKLNTLTILDLRYNELKTLPRSIGNLTNLYSIDVSHTQLMRLPNSLGDLTRLTSLFLHHNKLHSLPPSIGRMTDLTVLNVSENLLVTLPDSIGGLENLQEFNLAMNQLVSLPDSVGGLTRLKTLNLNDNELKDLPECLGQLTSLRDLHLAGNDLKTLPDSFRDLTSLLALSLWGNADLGLPAEVVNRVGKPTEVIEYYFRLQSGKQPINEAKLILVGRGGVGKTSIVNRLVSDVFKDEKKTEGINITEWNVVLNDDEKVRLNIWDFGGQEIMHATHQFFLTQRSLYLLVLTGREGGEDADAEYWLKLIASFGGESPVIVVLNKINEHPFDVNRRALQQKYPFVRHFIATDCEQRTGIDQLENAIFSETDRLEHLRDAFPASWFSIKDQLSAMKRNFLSFEEYRDVCAGLGETDRISQEALAFYLHSLGIALNYKDDPRLQDTHVLNPHWVTNGIYKILNSAILEKQKGEVQLRDLSSILDEEQYPARMHRFLIDLMKKFELCFSFAEDDTRYLIPELLDKQQPVEADLFKQEECLNFQYRYPILPEGLLPRFIVRTHVLSEQQPRWRTGVIMQFEECTALVKADVQEKRVNVIISGPVSNQRRLLAVIRSDFERIHRDISNLQPEQMVPIPGFPDVAISYEKLLAMERHSIKTFPEVAHNELVMVDVRGLLNGVDLEGSRKTDAIEVQKDAARLFISYSHKDDHLRKELENHLKIMHRQGLIHSWSDRRIAAGDEWKREIDDNLERADIILLLISSDFIASDYCYEKEMKRALSRESNDEARVIPVIVRDVNWKSAPFAELQVLPKDGKAVELWEHRDSAWRNVSEGIERALATMSRSRPGLS